MGSFLQPNQASGVSTRTINSVTLRSVDLTPVVVSLESKFGFNQNLDTTAFESEWFTYGIQSVPCKSAQFTGWRVMHHENYMPETHLNIYRFWTSVPPLPPPPLCTTNNLKLDAFDMGTDTTQTQRRKPSELVAHQDSGETLQLRVCLSVSSQISNVQLVILSLLGEWQITWRETICFDEVDQSSVRPHL